MRMNTAGLIGGGVIGSAWAARMLINAVDVRIYDLDPVLPARLDKVLNNALRAYRKMTLAPVELRGELQIVDSIEEAVSGAGFIQESGPERIELKKQLFQEIASHAGDEVVIASSSSGLLPSDMQRGIKNPERVIVGHPFNPVYLLPLVEIVGGRQTSEQSIRHAEEFYSEIGMHPLIVKKEVQAFLADRMMEALWRESLHLLNEGVATADELDQAIAYGPGIRWAFMGPYLTYRVAGGEGGMHHFMSQFGPSLKWPWTRFDGPDLTGDLLNRIAEQSDQQAQGRSISELEQNRDDCIVSILQGLRVNKTSAGQTLALYEEKLYRISHTSDQASVGFSGHDFTQPLQLHSGVVPPEWVDYNQHMTESSYLRAVGDASDALFQLIGANEEYHGQGFSYFTVETHLIHKGEIMAGEAFYFQTQILNLDAKRLHINHVMHAARDHRILATGEQMLLHVNTLESRSCPVEPAIMERLKEIYEGQRNLELPVNCGRSIQMPGS
ncbi:MAG: carnitine 3-dehydrogenase [Gammaproteobacteria bacterium]|nr:carnitine 3-dehydrogenase [Gammaproteobacteria bacterium]